MADDAPRPTTVGHSFAVTDVRAVLADRVVDDVTIVVEDGLVAAVRERGAAPPDAIDGHGLLALAGLVDTHSDGLEKEIAPRRTVELPVDFALGSFESRLRGTGITTVFHGLAYHENPDIGRSLARTRAVHDAITARRAGGRAGVDHRILYRLEARDEGAVDPLLADLEGAERAGLAGPLVSFEDHTPGQGQYRDRAQFTAALDPAEVPEDRTPEQHVDDLIAEAAARTTVRDTNLARLAAVAAEGRITLLAHDAEDRADIAAAAAAGASVAEFPVTREAAAAARDEGLWVVVGAPNALRGVSHSGNASARTLVAEGRCDVIASDYMPSALLACAFAMARDGVCALHEAIGLVTSGPARMAGLDDRGRLHEGLRGDLMLVDDRDRWPRVVAVRRADDDAVRTTGA